jgi:hypothetical protein
VLIAVPPAALLLHVPHVTGQQLAMADSKKASLQWSISPEQPDSVMPSAAATDMALASLSVHNVGPVVATTVSVSPELSLTVGYTSVTLPADSVA